MSSGTKLPDELRAYLDRFPDTRLLELLQPDMLGILRGKRIIPGECPKAFEGGVSFCGATVLLDAMDAPYSLPSPLTCREIAAQVRPLDEALGPDLDAAPSLDDPSLIERGEEAARGAGVAVVRGAAQSVVPMRGWVRRLTGAETHDRLVLQAITAGAVRRGYLKGLGKARNCLPPAAPQPIATSRQPSGVYPGLNGGPRYPIK